MFATLLKYEFRRTRKILLPLNLGALAIGAIGYFVMLIVTRLIDSADSEQLLVAPLLMLLWMGLFLILSLLGAALAIVLCLQFYREKFTDQGYLTFTLPATTHQILLSSYLNYLIWTIVNAIVTLISIGLMFTPFITYYIQESSKLGIEFSYFWELLKGDFAIDLPRNILYTVSNIVFTISSVFYGITLPYLAITLASVLAKKHKLLLAFGIGCGISLVIGMIPSIFSVIESLILYSDSALPEAAAYIPGTISQFLTAFLYIGFTVGGYFLMHYLISKKLNL